MAFLQLQQITKTYVSGPKRLEVLRQFDLEIDHGELGALVGRSGSGKTTLLNIIAGLDRPDSGSILLDGRDITKLDTAGWDHIRREELGIVFQFNQLLPEFTALENVILPGMLTEMDKDDLEKRARQLLERMEMDKRVDHRPSQLSGGEQQRVAIARALINGPRLLLADEPTGSLDLQSGEKVFQLLSELQNDLKISCLVVTHNPALANLCARIHRIDEMEHS